MESDLDDSDQSDEEIWFDETTLREFLKRINFIKAGIKKYV